MSCSIVDGCDMDKVTRLRLENMILNSI